MSSTLLPDEKILIIDFGSQYTQLIARRIREMQVFSEIVPCSLPITELTAQKPSGIILSGGPASVYQKDAPLYDKTLFSLSVPVMGICYGMQLICHLMGGKVAQSSHREYGRARLKIQDAGDIFQSITEETEVWMSHGDKIDSLPDGFEAIAYTHNSPAAAIRDPKRKIYGLQFHPEVVHTVEGGGILKNFVYTVCGCKPSWNMGVFLTEAEQKIKERVGNGQAISAISGGVDSSVASVLVQRAIGQRLHCIFVDNGLLRKNEAERVMETFQKNLGLNVRLVDASAEFLSKLSGVTDPEKKRKIIGETFITVFERESKAIQGISFLVQGTLYPDVIESVSQKGPSAKIKTHHNVGGLPERMHLALIEPLRLLFKDEVRKLGAELKMPSVILDRHPFPGPGLAVRILGEVTPERLTRLREADAIVEEEIRAANLYQSIWQVFAVYLPIQSVGVMGDERTYDNAIAIRAVTSKDGMTADWARIPHEVLQAISTRITNEVQGVNRVVYDISSKPPSTIEWE